MISCFLQGGLGNQMFQIAATLSFAWENGVESEFNLNIHNLPLQGNKAIIYKDIFFKNLKLTDDNLLNKCKIYTEPNFHYDTIPDYVSKENYLLNGYFQSEKYFIKYRDKIVDYFKPNNDIELYLKKYDNILEGNTCSIHVRRGDYLRFPNDHPILTIDYYKKSMQLFNDSKFLIFSDDIIWCKENFSGDNICFINDEPDYINLYLMSLCKNNIIANSSFSWWGAWLNKNNNKKIIGPKYWFGSNKNLNTKDLLPNKWIIL
jgi:hypothetical protein